MKKWRRSRWPGLLLAVIMSVVLMTGCTGAGKESTQEDAAVLMTVTEQDTQEETAGPEAEEASQPASEEACTIRSGFTLVTSPICWKSPRPSLNFSGVLGFHLNTAMPGRSWLTLVSSPFSEQYFR